MGLFSTARKGLGNGFTRAGAEADELQALSRDVGATSIANCTKGDVITACGVLSSVTMRPRAGVPALEADLYDGSGHLTLVWLGRRHIAGIEAGRSLVIFGRMACEGSAATIYNPRYELRPRGET